MKIEKGDLVIRRGRHAADVRFVEEISGDSILLVNGIADLSFEGEYELKMFDEQFRLLSKSSTLIKED